MEIVSLEAPRAGVCPVDESERWASFAARLDGIKAKVEAEMGEGDLAHVRKLRRFSRAMEVAGRACIHFSVEPLTFAVGVIALWLHKQLEATEIGHTALHGAYDHFGEQSGFYSKHFHWRVPIDEESWRHGHNVRHHGNTNVAGKDPDIHFGPVRLTEHTPWRPFHRWQLPFTLAAVFPNFGFVMNLHFTGLVDYYEGNGRGGMDFLPDRSFRTVVRAHLHAFRKYLPYYAKEYLLFPLLAGPLFWKVILGNWLSEVLRDVYSAATIYCGHVGEDVAVYPEGDKARSRGQWYARQVEASNDFEVSWAVSVLCGGLDRQIEHHLFPKLPPERLRQIAPEVRRACEEHGVRYRTATWPVTLKKALAHIARLSRREPSTRRAVRAVLGEMA
jgi:NADPH-dependent stearoyl-CoA 9-desaturase